MLWAVSRAPLDKLQAYKQRMGWTFPWASSFGSDFNSDFDVNASEEQQRTGAYEYNYPPGTPAATFGKPGMSAFAREDGTLYHTYFRLRARPRRALGRVSVARPRPQGPQRASILVASP